MKRPRESWLSSDDSDEWAAAMVACKSGAPWECGERGRCQFDGQCFTSDREGACAAWRMIQNLQTENEVTQRHLDRAVRFLRYGKADGGEES